MGEQMSFHLPDGDDDDLAAHLTVSSTLAVRSTGHMEQTNHRPLGFIPYLDGFRRWPQFDLALVFPEEVSRLGRECDHAWLTSADDEAFHAIFIDMFSLGQREQMGGAENGFGQLLPSLPYLTVQADEHVMPERFAGYGDWAKRRRINSRFHPVPPWYWLMARHKRFASFSAFYLSL
jgi:hypothetical protein